MRILIGTLSRSLIGGVEKYLQSLIPALLRHGHSVGLLYQYPPEANIERIDSGLDRLPAWCSMELGRESALRSIEAWAPDVVYSQGMDDGELERSLLESYPVALYAHTYWGTCISGRKCHSLPRLSPCARQFGAACLLLYYPRRCGGLNPRTMWKLFQLQSEKKSRLAEYQAVLVASRHMYREYQQHGVGEDRLHLVPLPMDDNPAGAASPPRKALGYRVLFVGRLMDVKGITYLLRAIPRAAAKLERSLHLTIAGDGPQGAELEGLARRLSLAVEFTGWVDTEQRSNLMRQADLLAVPSLWPEPFGMVGIEAGRFGVPAVGFRVGGIPDWLIPGQTGELAPGDPPAVEGLAEAIVRALGDGEHYQKLCAGAWEFARQFSLDRHIPQLEAILSARTPAQPLIPSIV
ncbi:MAG: glycosyltransferase family 4 protein [Bryobacteraceae bacterium]